MYVFVIFDGVYRVLQILSALYLLDQHMVPCGRWRAVVVEVVTKGISHIPNFRKSSHFSCSINCYTDGGIPECFPKLSVTSTLLFAPLLAPTPSPWHTSLVLSPFGMLEAFTWPLDRFTLLFSTFVRHPRLSTLPIYDFIRLLDRPALLSWIQASPTCPGHPWT